MGNSLQQAHNRVSVLNSEVTAIQSHENYFESDEDTDEDEENTSEQASGEFVQCEVCGFTCDSNPCKDCKKLQDDAIDEQLKTQGKENEVVEVEKIPLPDTLHCHTCRKSKKVKSLISESGNGYYECLVYKLSCNHEAREYCGYGYGEEDLPAEGKDFKDYALGLDFSTRKKK